MCVIKWFAPQCVAAPLHFDIYFHATLCFDQPTENNVAWQRFLPTGPIAMLPVINHFRVLNCCFCSFCPRQSTICCVNIRLCVGAHTAAVRHSELSGVVHQPPAGRGAAVPGRGELRGRRQLCLRESSFTSPQLQTSAAVFIDTLQQRADIVFLLSCRVRTKWRCLPRQLFSCVGAVFRNSCKTPTLLFSPRFSQY